MNGAAQGSESEAATCAVILDIIAEIPAAGPAFVDHLIPLIAAAEARLGIQVVPRPSPGLLETLEGRLGTGWIELAAAALPLPPALPDGGRPPLLQAPRPRRWAHAEHSPGAISLMGSPMGLASGESGLCSGP